VDEIAQLAARHGFRLSGFRSFERVVTDQQIEDVKKRRDFHRGR
jgi:fatty aldehyde-generating acyl-ACP reductase